MIKKAFLKYCKNCFWFFIPVIIFNIIFTKYLPENYLQNVSHVVVLLESITRISLIILSLVLQINTNNLLGKAGIKIYIIGLLIYFLSYYVIIKYSNTIFGQNMIVQLSGYWTSVLWLIGIGLIGNKIFLKIPYKWILYILISILFGIMHTYHGYILLTKL